MDEKKLEDGIYEVIPGKEWLVLEDGREQRFRSPDYDFPYLLRIYRGREDKVPFRGLLEGEGKPLPPSRGLTGVFTGPFSISGYDANGKRIPGHQIGEMFIPAEGSGHSSPSFDRMDDILEKTRKICDKLQTKK